MCRKNRRLCAGMMVAAGLVLGATYLVTRGTGSNVPKRALGGWEGAGMSGAPSMAHQGAAEAARRRIRMCMSAAFVSEAGLPVYGRIAEYLGDRLGMECELVTGLSYATINDMLESGAIEMGFVCGLPYVLMRDKEPPSVRLLAAPVMKAKRYQDRPKYLSLVIVHKDSPFASFADLKGCVYVYNEKLSNSGYNMPRARLVELKETGGFFGKVLRSSSHEESIRMVATGQADASSVDSLVLDYDLARNPQYARQVKVIETLGPAGIPPVVVSSKVPPALATKIQEALVGMKGDPEGRRILDDALVDRFEVVDDGNYDDIRRMKKAAEDVGFLEIK